MSKERQDDDALIIEDPTDNLEPIDIVVDPDSDQDDKAKKDAAPADPQAKDGQEGQPAKAEADGSKPATPAPQPADAGIEALKRQVQQAEAAKRQAEAIARQKTEEADAAQRTAIDSQVGQITEAINAAERDGEIAEAALKKAYEDGDFGQVAKIQRIISRIENRLSQLDALKAQVAQQQVQSRPIVTEGRVPDPVLADPVEAFAARLSPASAAWVRQHPDTVTDPAVNAEMLAAHHRALRAGIAADSPEYFAFVEERLGFRQAQEPQKTAQPQTQQAPARQTQQPPRMPAAPVSREAPPSASKPNGVVIRLTQAERQTARDLGMSEIDYAREKAALMREGRLGT